MLITRRNPIPTRWIFMAVLPWGAIIFQSMVMGTAFTFSLNKFIENPASLAFILSIPAFISMGLAPLAQLLSDRIWTRFGRRKPFVIAGGIGIYTGLLVMAFAPNAAVLILGYALYSVCSDLSGPIEPLKQEIVPPPQRGEATAVMQWFSNFSAVLFFTVVLGRFDEINTLAGMAVTGESAAYISCVMLGVSLLFLVMLGIKEVDPHSPLRGQRITIRNVLGGLLDKEFRPVYLLIFSSAILAAGLGPLGALLQTEQFGMTKQQMGYNVAVGTTLNLLIFIPLIGFLSDRLNRMRTYQALIIAALTIKLLFYVYVEFVLADHRVTWQEQVVFGEMLSVISILTQVVFTPLVYDYIRRDKMGTYAAGANILMRITSVITINGVGLFVTAYSSMLRPPAGEMVRVVMAEERPIQAVRADIATAWPAGRAAPVAHTWRATGMDLESGRGIEFRSRDKDSQTLDEAGKALSLEASGLEKLSVRTAAEAARLAALKPRITALTRELDTRAAAFRDEVVRRLGGRMLRDGDQVRSAAVVNGTRLTLPLDRRPTQGSVEQTLRGLRAACPDVVDLRLVKPSSGFAVELGVAASTTNRAVLQAVETRLRAVLDAAAPGVVSAAPAAWTPVRVLRLDLRIVEEPLDQFPSPINRWIVNPIKGWFGAAPTPEQRLNALGRSLRLKGATEQVRVEPAPGGEKAILVAAVLDPAAPAREARDAVMARLRAALAPGAAGQARAFYDRVLTAGAAQRITIARPVLAAAYAPLKYDYMSGYLWMFFLAAIGLALTFRFCDMEKRGLVREHGRDEARAERQIHDRLAAEAAAAGHPGQACGTYVPGYFWPKLGVMCLGLVLLALAARELWTPMRLLVTGQRTQAEAVRILKSRPNGETRSYTDDALARAAEEKRDRTWQFATEFRYATGRHLHTEETAVCPVRNRLQPIYRLTDEDGLPSAVPVWYDRVHPKRVVFPAMIATWFLPAMVALFGLINLYIGAMLAWHARRPIELPPPPVAPSLV